MMVVRADKVNLSMCLRQLMMPCRAVYKSHSEEYPYIELQICPPKFVPGLRRCDLAQCFCGLCLQGSTRVDRVELQACPASNGQLDVPRWLEWAFPYCR